MKIALLIFVFLVLMTTAYGQGSDLVGEWKNGSVGMIQYQNRTTGATKPGRGSIFTYKFLANGTYEFVGYMESTMYNCTTTLFNQINGKYRIYGSTLLLDPSRDFWKNTNSCAAGSNKQQTKTPTKKVLEFERKEDEYGAEMLCIIDGSSETCFRKESK